jgi:hypothetical protein
MRSRVACLAIGAVALTAGITGCGGDDSSSDDGTPEAAVQQFFDSAADGDGAGACEVLSADSQEQAVKEAKDASDCEGAFQEDADAGNIDVPDDYEIGEATIDGDTASVEVTSQGQTFPFPLVQEDGEWKLDLVGSSSAG